MGRPKLLLPFGDTTVAGALIESLRNAGVERIVVVLAPGDAALRSWLAGSTGIEIAENPRPERGMLSSVLCGVEALGGAASLTASREPLLVTPADLPTIQPSTIGRLLAVLGEGGAALAVPTYRGRRGHPLAIAARLVTEIAALDPAVGLRQLLARHPVVELAVEDPGVVADVDTPADYVRLDGDRRLRE